MSDIARTIPYSRFRREMNSILRNFRKGTGTDLIVQSKGVTLFVCMDAKEYRGIIEATQLPK